MHTLTSTFSVFLSFLPQPADDFNIHGWAERVRSAKRGGNAWELPVGPKRSWQARCQGKRTAVKNIQFNKQRQRQLGSPGAKFTH